MLSPAMLLAPGLRPHVLALQVSDTRDTTGQSNAVLRGTPDPSLVVSHGILRPGFRTTTLRRPTARQEIADQPKRIPAWVKLSVSPLGPTRSWRKRWSHVPRNLCPSARQLRLDCSLRQSQNSGRLKDREP